MSRLSPTSGPASATLPARPTLRGEAPRWRLAVERARQMRALYRDWPVAMLDRAGLFRSDQVHVYAVTCGARGFSLLARRNGFDVRAINELWIGRVYDRWLSLLDDRRARTVVDVGANCGYFAVLAAGVLGADHLLCIEPDPGNARLLRANLALNGIAADVEVAAVVGQGDAGTVTLHRSIDPRLHSLLTPTQAIDSGLGERSRSAGSIQVPARSLAAILDAHAVVGVIDLMKVDIEGMEWEVVDSLADDQLRRVRCLVVESDVPMPDALQGRLRGSGFEVRSDLVFWAAVRRR